MVNLIVILLCTIVLFYFLNLGNPFQFFVTDVNRVVVRGEGLGLVRCNQPASFNISAPGAQLKDIDVQITGISNCNFARLSRASFMSHLLAPPSCRARPSPWLALWYGMVSHWLSGHFLEYSPRNSFSNLKQHYSATLGLGALLSSPT